MEIRNEVENLIKILVQAIASMLYCFFVASKFPKGKFRLFSLLPIFSLFFTFPSPFQGVLLTGALTFIFSWLCNLKLLLFAFDQGPLSSDRAKSFLPFIVFAIFPIKVKEIDQDNSPKDPFVPLTWHVKLVILGLLTSVYDNSGNLNPNKIEFLLVVVMLYLLIDAIMNLSQVSAQAVLGIELEQASDEPYLSTTLQDFWGKRWNLRATNILRIAIFIPIKVYFKDTLGSHRANALGIFSSFLVSGLMHELMFYYWKGKTTPTWEATTFFTLHGVFVSCEFEFIKWVKKHSSRRLPQPMAVPLTVAFVLVTVWWGLYPQLVNNGILHRAIGEGKSVVEFFIGIPKLALQVFVRRI